VVIHVLDVLLRRKHVMVLKCFPSSLLRIVRGVEDNAMRVQMWIERSGCRMLEKRGDDIPCAPVPIRTAFSNACRREPFQFRNSSAHSLTMSSYNP
jgi:hypothetical protein